MNNKKQPHKKHNYWKNKKNKQNVEQQKNTGNEQNKTQDINAVKETPLNPVQTNQTNNLNSGNNNNQANQSGQQNQQKNKKFFQNRRNDKKFFKNKHFDKNKQLTEESTKPKEPIVYEICAICEKEIAQPLYAIKDANTGKNAHFECIQRQIAQVEPLENDERIYYLGGGSFGIVKERRQRGKIKFVMRKRIQYVEKK